MVRRMANIDMLLAFFGNHKNRKVRIKTNQEELEGILLSTDSNANLYVQLPEGKTVIQRKTWNRVTLVEE